MVPFSYRFHCAIEHLAPHFSIGFPATYQTGDGLVKRIAASATELIQQPGESINVKIVGGTGVGHPGTWQETMPLTRLNTPSAEAAEALRDFVRDMDRSWWDFRQCDGEYSRVLAAIVG